MRAAAADFIPISHDMHTRPHRLAWGSVGRGNRLLVWFTISLSLGSWSILDSAPEDANHGEAATVLTNPNPTELKELDDPEMVAQHRSLFCIRYDECLEHAADCAWHSWSCERCSLYALRYRMAARYAQATYHCACGTESVGAI